MLIQSLLDTDLYKFTMMQCVLHQFPDAQTEYNFLCRTPNINLLPYKDEIESEIDQFCRLRFDVEELTYLKSLRFIKNDFVEFLRIFQLNRDYINVFEKEGHLAIEIKGPWLHTILFEVPVLAIVNEIYFRHHSPQINFSEGRKRLEKKIELILNEPENDQIKILDFGTRRRFSRQWQIEVLKTMKNRLPKQFMGTSNVQFAKEMDLVPIGTMAHEYLQACQVLAPNLRSSQIYAFDMWAKEYRGDLGIALTDVYGIEPFLNDFDMFFCKLFDGVRQDSGDPFVWGEKMIKHYENNHCDPKTKRFVFSDALTFPEIISLYRRFKHRVNISFGIGTNLMNDLGPDPLNIVIKMVEVNGSPVAKISDTPEKTICTNVEYLRKLKEVFDL